MHQPSALYAEILICSAVKNAHTAYLLDVALAWQLLISKSSILLHRSLSTRKDQEHISAWFPCYLLLPQGALAPLFFACYWPSKLKLPANS